MCEKKWRLPTRISLYIPPSLACKRRFEWTKSKRNSKRFVSMRVCQKEQPFASYRSSFPPYIFFGKFLSKSLERDQRQKPTNHSLTCRRGKECIIMCFVAQLPSLLSIFIFSLQCFDFLFPQLQDLHLSNITCLFTVILSFLYYPSF